MSLSKALLFVTQNANWRKKLLLGGLATEPGCVPDNAAVWMADAKIDCSGQRTSRYATLPGVGLS